ncbi:(d)CMP kinase [Maribacter sp. HTCC2170]|uniref:(d)CMP kinase n=1 Tax=Maribacter sp. (strain HTCC2170 / KCCM 42371) TaxID=313603 RepID=UPI00006B482E|nr:(d)CMP kinase [Maribacter sp. HTCC2170]EAR01906.1 cytidylate kinase [Maribacter sp. HTCC2170]
MEKITIAIDGYSSTGKSTIAKQLAKVLGYIYVDTGAMYRAVTLYAMEKGYVTENKSDIDGLVGDLKNINLKFIYNDTIGFAEMHLNNKNVERKIRTMEVSRLVSKVATIEDVRKKLVLIQKQMGLEKGIVMDGRDIGTVVFPNAELKIFMTASPEKRATRRYKELLDKGEDVSYGEVLKNVEHRDYIDTHREISPLTKAEDAITFDNSDMGLEEQFNRILDFTNRVIKKQKRDVH